MDVHQCLLKEILLPLRDNVYGRSTLKCLNSLKKFQWLNPEEIRKIQIKRLNALLNFSYEYVPYYHRLFRECKLKPSDVQDLSDLKKIPVLTKDILRKNFQELIATNASARESIFCSTSGTTGEPVNFIKTKYQQSWETAAGYLMTNWYGFEPGYKHALIWALPSSFSVLQKKVNYAFREKFLNSFKLTKERMRQFAHELTSYKPDVLRGYSNMLYFFAQFVKEEGIEIRPGSIVSTGEDLLDFQRRRIEKSFGCDVFSLYASREISAIAAECSTHQGHHIMADNVILEVIKDRLPIASEEIGQITLTNLCNYTMPLIRYQLGDLGSLSNEKCNCGRTLPLLKSVDGRVSDVLVDRYSRYTASPSVHFVFKNLPVKQYQIVQETEKELVIKLVQDSGYSVNTEKLILHRIKQYIGFFEVFFDYVDFISSQKSGKKRVIISHLPNVLSLQS